MSVIHKEVFEVPEGSPDSRIRVFRRSLSVVDQFELQEVNAYAVITTHYVVICDTLLCPEDMSILVQALHGVINGRQLLVVNSHADWDHCWGNGYFTGTHAAPIIAHEACRAYLLSREAHSKLHAYQRFPIFRHTVLMPPSVTFADTLTLHGGDLTLKLFHAPGHQPEHLALWIPELRLLFAFDAAEQPFPHIESAASVPSMFATLHRMLALQPQYVFCSHAEGASEGILGANLAYLQEIERRCRSFLNANRPPMIQVEQAAKLIGYAFDAVVAQRDLPLHQLDHTYYRAAHEENVHFIMQWLLNAGE